MTGEVRLHATLTKAENETRYLIIDSLDGSSATKLSLMSGGVETAISSGTEYETGTKADELIKSWTQDQGFKWLSDKELAWEPLSTVIALAKRIGFVGLYDGRFKQMNRLPLNPIGLVPLDDWPGMTPKNGGGYVYALAFGRLYALPTSPPNLLPVIAPTGSKEFAEFMLKHIELRKSVGDAAEFVLTER